jgi:hypothetical protein
VPARWHGIDPEHFLHFSRCGCEIETSGHGLDYTMFRVGAGRRPIATSLRVRVQILRRAWDRPPLPTRPGHELGRPSRLATEQPEPCVLEPARVGRIVHPSRTYAHRRFSSEKFSICGSPVGVTLAKTGSSVLRVNRTLRPQRGGSVARPYLSGPDARACWPLSCNASDHLDERIDRLEPPRARPAKTRLTVYILWGPRVRILLPPAESLERT